MRILIAFAGISLAAFGASLATPQQKPVDACKFKMSESATNPTITGPEDVVAIAHVIDQPDSPVEILSADFKSSFVSVANERFTDQLHCSIKIRNRGDQTIRDFSLSTELQPVASRFIAGAGLVGLPGPRNGRSLAPGQEVEIEGCGTGGSGSAPNNRVFLLLAIDSVSVKDCIYVPSRRFPDFFDN
jgi:hypothetical protein